MRHNNPTPSPKHGSGRIHAIAKIIDHTLLKPDAGPEQVRRLCREARTFGFASVCVNPCHVRFAAACLKNTGVKTGTVAGFPLGASASRIKAAEARAAVADGADEIDMVMNIGALKARDFEAVRADIRAVRVAAKGKVLKVILETCLLERAEIVRACRIARGEGADFVKTSTGFSSGGATVAAVKLMRGVVGPDAGVKASGGIKTLDQALALVRAGATRIGSSSSVSWFAAGTDAGANGIRRSFRGR